MDNTIITNLLGETVIYDHEGDKEKIGEIVGIDENFGLLVAFNGGDIMYYANWTKLKLKKMICDINN